MKFSNFGMKFTAKSGIQELMDDMGRALSSKEKISMMGGGNPAIIPEVTDLWFERMTEIMSNRTSFEKLLGEYDPPQGNSDFIGATVSYLNSRYGWGISERNMAVTNGSQNSFFYLFNILAGEFADGKKKKILFPITPEYIGYADQGIQNDMFTAAKPNISFLGKNIFKYNIDFENIDLADDIGAVCVSRPTNPTGNVITDGELHKLDALCRSKDIPLIIDNAYGDPFPSIIFEDTELIWNRNIILSMSLSKIGMPSARTGFIIADERIIDAVSSVNSIISLANTKIGQMIATPLISSGMLNEISRNIIRPFYKQKSDFAIDYLINQLGGNTDFFIHKCEGSIFLWVWFRSMKITSRELYKKLKEHRVIIVPGEYFFPGLDTSTWEHTQKCIRINYGTEEIERGLEIICKTVKNL